MRLIDADALMKEFAKYVEDSNNSDFAKCPTWNDAISLLESAPTIEEQKKGQWINDVAYYDEDGCPCIVTRCNQCGEVNEAFNFCPNCGADMRGESIYEK